MNLKKCMWMMLAMLPVISFVSCGDDKEVVPDNSTVIAGHKAVDLGLPSGTLWADMNIGAITAKDRGDFFQWGETARIVADENVNWNDKYVLDGLAVTSSSVCGTDKDALFVDGIISKTADGKWVGSIAGTKYDAATVNWGTAWRMPTDEQLKELRTYCTWTEDRITGYEGYKVTGKNGNSIFFPLGGYRQYLNLDRGGSIGCLWSANISSVTPSQACYFSFEINQASGNARINSEDRYFGFNIRPVATPIRYE